jgi:hypothetical protein
MINFIIGFVVAWALCGIILYAEDKRGDIVLWDDLITYLLLLPIILFILLIEYINEIKRKEKRK